MRNTISKLCKLPKSAEHIIRGEFEISAYTNRTFTGKEDCNSSKVICRSSDAWSIQSILIAGCREVLTHGLFNQYWLLYAVILTMLHEATLAQRTVFPINTLGLCCCIHILLRKSCLFWTVHTWGYIVQNIQCIKSLVSPSYYGAGKIATKFCKGGHWYHLQYWYLWMSI